MGFTHDLKFWWFENTFNSKINTNCLKKNKTLSRRNKKKECGIKKQQSKITGKKKKAGRGKYC